MNLEKRIATFIKQKISTSPKLAIILGSGLSGIETLVENPIIIPYDSIPDYPHSSVQGHKNRFVFGYVNENPILLCSGRFHFYEGFPMETVTLPIRVLKELNTENLLITNAAGGIGRYLKPTDIMLIHDHLNLTGHNPLIGYKGELPVFIDMSAYSPKLIKKMQISAKKAKINLKSGVYAFQTGPSYETPAEIQFLKKIGADAVGMSTVPEVIVARQEGIPTVALSIITNKAAGLSGNKKLGHEEVLENSLKAQKNMVRLIETFVREL